MVRKNEPTEYTPTWKKSHASRNGFNQTHIQSVIMGQAGRPAFSIPRITTKDKVLEQWRQQDRAIVRNGGHMAADYEEIDQTYEEAGEDPDAALPPLRPVREPHTRERRDNQPKDSVDSGEPIVVTGNKRSRDAGEGDEVEEDDEQPTIPQDGAHETGTKVPQNLHRNKTQKVGAERPAVTESKAQPAVDGEETKEENTWPINYTLPAKLPKINDMKDYFRYRWNIKFTRVSRTEDIKPLWIRLYQTYGPEVRDLNLDFTDGKYQGAKDKSREPILPLDQDKENYRKRALPPSIDPQKRRKRNNGTVAKLAQTGRVETIAAEPTEDVGMGGMDPNSGQKSNQQAPETTPDVEMEGVESNSGHMIDAPVAASNVANPSLMLKSRLESTIIGQGSCQALQVDRERVKTAQSTQKKSLIVKVKVGHLEKVEMRRLKASQAKASAYQPDHGVSSNATSHHAGTQDTDYDTENFPATDKAASCPQAKAASPTADNVASGGVSVPDAENELESANEAIDPDVLESEEETYENEPDDVILDDRESEVPRHTIGGMGPSRKPGNGKAKNFGPGHYTDPKVANAWPIEHKVDSYLRIPPLDEHARTIRASLNSAERIVYDQQKREIERMEAEKEGRKLPPKKRKAPRYKYRG
ncbi:hypothetical protein FB567DRAFT_587816 [Paraphoma chrysanthemicola]|uniref:Uncharacterized protein n=1 Tax=Paraphoma chrysanthemicola TaxID=798071 RepID=A0A8K0RH93_9PLEO|nr:hypothetical protein FB567DRAFT_587816 [Paraphoma chrysanthemicola]